MSNARTYRLQGEYLFLASVVIQLGLTPISVFAEIPSGLVVTIWLLTTAALALVAFSNSRPRGLWIMGLGLVLNLVVVAANGAMPVDLGSVGTSEAQVLAAVESLSGDSLHEELTPDSLLPWIADTYAVTMGGHLMGVFSIGDILLSLGAGVAAFEVTRPRDAKKPPASA